MIELIKVIKEKQLEKESEQLSSILELCDESLNFIVEEIAIKENAELAEKKTSLSAKVFKHAKAGVSISNILHSEIYDAADQEDVEIQNMNEDEQHRNTITRTKRQKTLLEYIYQILEEVSDRNIIVIYDELDKMDDDILKILFGKYKTLFVEKDLFNFFIVNDIIYRKYSDSNLMINPTYSYFMGRYYIPLLNFKETLRYSKMMFGEESYLSGLVTYYLCVGNYRLINQKYLSAYSNECLDIVKAYIMKKVVEKTCLSYFDGCMRDMLVRKIKAAIERIIIVRKFNVTKLATEMSAETQSVEIWPDYNVIVECIIEEILSVCSKAVEKDDEVTIVKSEELIYNYNLIEELIESDRDVVLSEKEKKYIQLSDLYHLPDGYYTYKKTEICFLEKDLIILKVADNEYKSYKETLRNLLHTSFTERGVQVIVIRRARGEESDYANDYEYTGMVIVDKGKYQIAYYVDKGSYEHDKREAIDGLIEEAEKLNIDVAYLTAVEHIDVKKDIACIVGRYNNPNSELYEHRKVVFDNWK